jgi:hypothetical protein
MNEKTLKKETAGATEKKEKACLGWFIKHRLW